MKETEENRKAWSLLAEDHYNVFLAALKQERHLLNPIIVKELGDLTGKTVLHLQCNTGADSISLARLGAGKVVGIDFVPENIRYAGKLAAELGVANVEFVESDILQLTANHSGRYDVVFTSEGVIGWLPDLEVWGRTISHFLVPGGIFYVYDSHPFMSTLDEELLKDHRLAIKYPYFKQTPDADDYIGGYAAKPRPARNYYWMYTVSDVVNNLVNAGLSIDCLNEYDTLFYDLGGMEKVDKGLYCYPFFRGKLPLAFSVKATLGEKK